MKACQEMAKAQQDWIKAHQGRSSFIPIDTTPIAVQLFYRNKLIDLAKGKNAAEVSISDEIISVLIQLKDAVNDASLTCRSNLLLTLRRLGFLYK
jgi:hypothetical protein